MRYRRLPQYTSMNLLYLSHSCLSPRRSAIDPSKEDASDDVERAILQGSLSYDSGIKERKLEASLTELYATALVEFFKEGEKAHVGPLINSIAMGTLDA
ncbi:hypothetical protein F4779DRAFT_605749 [Xylariaceae sp. FL0662B]|nr:hypothetical protein F4779DRAFT_605749 [Xylariaceae sp. FL0662B]